MKGFDTEEPPNRNGTDKVDVVVADADNGIPPYEYLDLSWQFEEFWEVGWWCGGWLPSSRSQNMERRVERHSANCQVHNGEACIHFRVPGREL